VKVNVLDIVLTSSTGNAAALEERLQAWLKDNPSAQIEHVIETRVEEFRDPLVSKGTTYATSEDHFLVTIFYRD
jgi:hypothetical protein